jgi:Glycosyltransferase family 10 (fucosyltransferase) C-term
MKSYSFNHKWAEFDFPFLCEIHPNGFYMGNNIELDNYRAGKDIFKVLVIGGEPEPIRISEHNLNSISDYFDLIISHDKRHYLYENAVVTDLNLWTVDTLPIAKNFSISNIHSTGGGPRDLSGYLLRDQVFDGNEDFIIEKNWFVSNRIQPLLRKNLPTLIGDKRDCLFTSMFNLSIENTIESDYFTEKLQDCFQTFTVPIYYGCPNLRENGISEDGIIRINNIEECINIINNLTVDDYYGRIPYLYKNYQYIKSKINWLEKVQIIIMQAAVKKYGNINLDQFTPIPLKELISR